MFDINKFQKDNNETIEALKLQEDHTLDHWRFWLGERYALSIAKHKDAVSIIDSEGQPTEHQINDAEDGLFELERLSQGE